MTIKSIAAFCFVAFASLIAGCGGGGETASNSNPDGPPISGTAYILDAEPDDAQTVIEARESAQDGDAVVVLGRIGGSVDPWNEGRAAFSIVDPTLAACSDRENDSCTTPWDYCCEIPLLKTGSALVKVVDAEGNVVKSDARKLLGVKELDTVVVRGTAQRDDAGNLTVLATGVHVHK